MDTHKQSKASTSKPNQQQIDRFTCAHCNLHFSSYIWMQKHINRCHSGKEIQPQRSPIVKMPDLKLTHSKTKSNVLNFKQKLNAQDKMLNRIGKNPAEQSNTVKRTLKSNTAKYQKSKKSKQSPKKSLLREQLKRQLEEQRKLLKVQQEIFEKANKTQDDIYKLLAKLGDDDDDDEENDYGEEETELEEVEEEEIVEEEYLENEEFPQIEHVDDNNRTKYRQQVTKHEVKFEQNQIDGNPSYETIYFDGGMGEEYILPIDIPDQNTSQESYIILNDVKADSENVHYSEQNMMVVVRSEDGEDEFELIDVVDENVGTIKGGDSADNIQFEFVCDDTDGVHCRIITAEPEEEYIEMTEKAPVKVDVGKISKFTQRRLRNSTKMDAPSKASSKADRMASEEDKQNDERIQSIIQSAVPTSDNKFECPMCKEVVSNRYSLGPHILRLHSKQKSKICPHCDRAFTCTGDLTR